MDEQKRKYNNMKSDKERRLEEDSSNSIVLELTILLTSAALTMAAFLLIYYFAAPDFDVETINVSQEIMKIKENATKVYKMNTDKKRTKREVTSLHLKEKLHQELSSLMNDPRCKGSCEEIRKKFNRLEEGIDNSITQLTNLKKEIDSIASYCRSSKFQHELKPSPNEAVNHTQGKFASDQELAGSIFQLNKYVEGIPPTGPDASATGSGPGEVVETSQQMTVSLPHQVQPICRTVPGPSGSPAYICTPTQTVPNENINLQGSVNHRPNFTLLNQYSSSVPSQQLIGPQYLAPSQTYMNILPQLQYYPQQQMLTQLTQPQQISQVLPMQYPIPTAYQQPSFQGMPPSPPMVPPPQYQQQFMPQFYVPQHPMMQTPYGINNQMLQCSYAVVPNSPVQTYQFPIVTGVSETIRRSEDLSNIKGSNNVTNENMTSPRALSNNENCAPGTVSCDDHQKCLPELSWCDSNIDCLDMSDESRCTCRDLIEEDKVCDGYLDCPKGEDELECLGCNKDSFSCDGQSLSQGKFTCLSLEHRCDGIRDCANGVDESDCLLISEEEQAHKVPFVSYSKGFLYRNWKGNWYHVCSAQSWQFQACSAEVGRLSESPQESFISLKNRPSLLINENELGIELVHLCPGAEGSALWVDCPLPECGMKPLSIEHLRLRRDFPNSPPIQTWIDPRPGEEEPQFKSVPEVNDFMKDFFNSISIFDKKKYYKRLWGPLLQPYLGVNNFNEKEQKVPKKTDPTQDSWKYYQHAHYSNNFNQPSLYYSQNMAYMDNQAHPFQENTHLHTSFYGNYPQNIDYKPWFPEHTESLYYTNTHHNPSGDGSTPNNMNPSNTHLPHTYDSYPSYAFYQQAIDGYNPTFEDSPLLLLHYDNRTKREEEARVVGGRRSEPGSWPWLVVMHKDGIFHCGGTILRPDVILTAAHCMDNYENHYFEIRAGILRRLSYSPQQQIRKVNQVIIHENYDSNDMTFDIALLKLSSELKFNRWVLPACLPPPDPTLPPPGSICTAIGWGAIFEHGPDPDHLKEVRVPVWPNCKEFIDRLGHEICAGYPEGGRDTCQGDSGGPLLCQLNNNKWYIAGIVSHGEGCGRKGQPGVYTRVSLFYSWIIKNMEGPRSSSKPIQQNCPGFECGTGECIPPEHHCDKHVDCIDLTDEENCDGFVRAINPMLFKSAFENLTETTSENYFTEPTDSSWSTMKVDFVGTTNSPIETNGKIELHSQQLLTVNLTDLFSCKRLNQRILASRVCDNIVDCEDGSDEFECSCLDKLKYLSPKLICNGEVDCNDSTDELYCPKKCSSEQFYCHITDLCIPIKKRCDRNRDCYYSEDENDCYALIENKLTLDVTGNPPLLINGTAVVYQNGHWESICNEKNPSSRAITICRSLGFRISREFKEVEVFKFPKEEEEEVCQGLMVSCSAPDRMLWTAPLFVNGTPVTLAALISREWLLVPISSLQINVSDIHLSCWLGKSNFTLDILGPYDQFIRVVGVASNSDLCIALLHLEQPANITRLTAPLPLPDWPTPYNGGEKCEGIGMNSEGDIISVHLEPIPCPPDYRCFVRDRSEKFCKLKGLVICHSEYGSYIASVISEDICLSPVLKLPDIMKHKEYILNYLDKKIDYEYEIMEEICETIRCENGKCLNWSQIGDGVSNCYDSRDEENEAWERKEKHCFENNLNCSCKPGFIRCRSGECIDSQKFCNEEDDCKDASDEEDCSCAGYIALARPHMLCDGNQNCIDKTDEDWAHCNNSNCFDEKKFQCPNSDVCIPKDFVCDGDPDCPASKDEEFCIALRSPIEKPGEGLVFSVLFGQMIPQCLELDHSFGEVICSAQELEYELSHSSKVPKISVLTDAFSFISLNNKTSVSLRTDRPFASVVHSNNETCQAMYVYCN